MYPYYYPSYVNPVKRPGPYPQSDMQSVPDVGAGAVPGKTAGQPVEPTAPARFTIQPLPVDFKQTAGPPVTTDIEYTQAFLKTQIGKKVRIEFLIGTSMLTDRIGILTDVGISYVIIKPVGTDDRMLCDIYSIKFVTFYA